MTIHEITDQDAWDDFQSAQPYSQFLQSWSWGDFRLSQGVPVQRFALVDEAGAWLAALQMEFQRRRFGVGYWYAARGPVFTSSVIPEQRREIMMSLCEQLVRRPDLKKQALFWRMEPVSELSRPEGLIPLSFRRTHAMSPASTIVMDLAPPTDELLRKMHEKTRYNVRISERFKVNVRVASTEKDVETFLNLMDETAARDGFVSQPRDYLRATYDFLHERNAARIRIADLDGRPLAANLEMAFGDTVTYLHGASSSEHRNVMAPYALQWHAIREAKMMGFKLYDFWGANPLSQAMYYYKPSWEGITRFKRGWGGRQVDLMGTWDLPFNMYLYRMIFWRQFFRG